MRIIASGAAISAAFTAASLAAASLTDRRAFASIGVILLLWGSSGLTGALVEGAEMTEQLYAFDLGGISDELKNRIYAAEPQPPPGENEFVQGYGRSRLSNMFVVGANLAWVAFGAGIVWWRYRRLALSR